VKIETLECKAGKGIASSSKVLVRKMVGCSFVKIEVCKKSIERGFARSIWKPFVVRVFVRKFENVGNIEG